MEGYIVLNILLMSGIENLINNSKVRLFLIFLSAFSPFIYIFFYGKLPSISSYWETSMQPLFIFVNASTSYFFLSIKKWWAPGLFLMFLTAFPIDQFFIVHNIFAVLFFLSCGISMSKSRDRILYIVPYIASLFFLLDRNILYSEISAILVIFFFHLHRFIKYRRVSKGRESLK